MKNYLDESGNIHLSYYLEAADILNIKYEVLVKSLLARFEHQNKHWFIINTVTPLVNSPGKTIAYRKNLTNIVLAKAGIPIPKQRVLKNVEEAIGFFNENKSIVIKPEQGIGGKGVSILPGSFEEVKSCFENSKGYTDSVIIGEEYISGENYRLLTLGEKVIGALRRTKPKITGDGGSTVEKIIKTQNPKIPLDAETVKELKRQGLTLQSIPTKGQVVYARQNTNLTTGGETEECHKEVHPYYEELAVKAIKAIGIKLGGVDLITEDITKPAKCAINEINYNPGLRIHYQANKGDKVKVAIPIMEYIRDNEI